MHIRSILASPVMHWCCSYQFRLVQVRLALASMMTSKRKLARQGTEGHSELKSRHRLLDPGMPPPGVQATKYVPQHIPQGDAFCRAESEMPCPRLLTNFSALNLSDA